MTPNKLKCHIVRHQHDLCHNLNLSSRGKQTFYLRRSDISHEIYSLELFEIFSARGFREKCLSEMRWNAHNQYEKVNNACTFTVNLLKWLSKYIPRDKSRFWSPSQFLNCFEVVIFCSLKCQGFNRACRIWYHFCLTPEMWGTLLSKKALFAFYIYLEGIYLYSII